MKTLNHIGSRPVSLPVSADDIVEFHAARILLLLGECGVKGRIEGLTKMAKLDFFVRYPDFFSVAQGTVAPKSIKNELDYRGTRDTVESAMVRHHYGPWDKRYYHVLAYLEAKGLITVTKEGKSYVIRLTELGNGRAKVLSGRPSFALIVKRMREVKKTFGNKSGNHLKNMIYRLFDAEVSQRPLGEVIKK